VVTESEFQRAAALRRMADHALLPGSRRVESNEPGG